MINWKLEWDVVVCPDMMLDSPLLMICVLERLYDSESERGRWKE
jgi:hypothetical protein